MKTSTNAAGLLLIAGCIATIVTLIGCSSPSTASPGTVGKTEAPETSISGSEAWDQNCARCHNSISPTTYSDQQWDAIMMHMRIHARLTGQEERAILKFLKASN
jgi:hypothetical protein